MTGDELVAVLEAELPKLVAGWKAIGDLRAGQELSVVQGVRIVIGSKGAIRQAQYVAAKTSRKRQRKRHSNVTPSVTPASAIAYSDPDLGSSGSDPDSGSLPPDSSPENLTGGSGGARGESDYAKLWAFYDAEFLRVKGAAHVLIAGKEKRHGAAIRDILKSCGGLEKARSVVRKALGNQWQAEKRCEPWHILTDINNYIGDVTQSVTQTSRLNGRQVNRNEEQMALAMAKVREAEAEEQGR